MIVIVTMKTPDALNDACRAAAPDRESAEKASDIIAEKWMVFGEYLQVRFDTDDGTAEVIPR